MNDPIPVKIRARLKNGYRRVDRREVIRDVEWLVGQLEVREINRHRVTFLLENGLVSVSENTENPEWPPRIVSSTTIESSPVDH